jgi:hypothetical protein
MLNEVGHTHLGGRLTALNPTTTSTPSISVGTGLDDLSDSTRTSAGLASLTLKQPSARLPVVVASPGANIADGGYVQHGTLPTKSVVTLTSLDASGVADDGEVHSILFGWDYQQLEHVGLRDLAQLKNTNGYEPILFGLHITSAGVATIGSPLVSIALADTSEYTITFREGFSRAPIVIASPINSTCRSLRVKSTSTTNCVIQTFNAGGTKTAADFQVFLLAWRHKDPSGQRRSIVQSPRRRPKVIPFEITDTAGTPSVTIGSDDFTVVDNGVGDYILVPTAASSWINPPVCVATGKSTRAQLASAPTTTVINVKSFNAAGSATDGSIHGVVFGWDVLDEYRMFG